jgi:hypothetical protein
MFIYAMIINYLQTRVRIYGLSTRKHRVLVGAYSRTTHAGKAFTYKYKVAFVAVFRFSVYLQVLKSPNANTLEYHEIHPKLTCNRDLPINACRLE